MIKQDNIFKYSKLMNRIISVIILIMFLDVHILFGQTFSKTEYEEKLRGFWLGSSIANWTGLITEGVRNDKPYFTDEDWYTNQGHPWHGGYIDFVIDKEIWGADDDTDIEYIYQHAMETYDTYLLTGEHIKTQWLEHIYQEEENFLWVSNESAFYLMLDENMTPPATSLPHNNENWEMIDAQLTTEIFGLLAPGNPEIALKLSYLPVRTTAYSHSMFAAQFYIIMHSLASSIDPNLSRKEQVLWLADSARTYIPDSSYIADMYDWVRNEYMNMDNKNDWETVRDDFHDYYIEGGANEYTYSAFYDSGSNFGFSIISLLFGEGDFKRTIQIGTLSGQDSDNPTATWGGLLGFMYGFEGLEKHFDYYNFSEKYDINRTRKNFGGGDNFDTYHEHFEDDEQYIGYKFNEERSFNKIIFQEGRHSEDGGWFANNSLRLQLLKEGRWIDVEYQINPAYPNGDELVIFGEAFSNYTFTLSEKGNGIRLIGKGGGGDGIISISELEVFEKNQNIASEGDIIASVMHPTGGGIHNIEVIRNGIKDEGDKEIDSFTNMAKRLLPLIDKVVIEQMNGTASNEHWTIGNKSNSNKYYISSINGKTDGDGSKESPWDTLDDIDGYPFLPGDSVFFEKGSKWIGTFEIKESGSISSPIVFTSYGKGKRPALSNPDISSNDGNVIRISSSHIVIDDLFIHDCGQSEPRKVAGIASFNREDHHITIQNSEFSGCRVGVRLYAHDVLITNNYMHSPGGGINEWWGPMGIVVAGYNGDISFNTIEGFLAPNNYGFDGGAIEIDDEGNHTNWKIHHNITRGNQGFLETYDDSECEDCTWSNIEISYNFSDDYQWFTDGPIGNNPIIENNTVLRVLPANTKFNWGISLHDVIPDGFIRNNIFVLANGVKAFEWEDPGEAASNNIYYSIDQSLKNPKGYALGPGEIISEPGFVNYKKRNLNLAPGSPAIDKALLSRYPMDVQKSQVAQGNAPDIGAFESKYSALVARIDFYKENATVELDAKNSSAELNQSISKYMWDFGDGNISSSSNVNHSYDKSGNYVITLTVESTSGMSSSISKQITIHE